MPRGESGDVGPVGTAFVVSGLLAVVCSLLWVTFGTALDADFRPSDPVFRVLFGGFGLVLLGGIVVALEYIVRAMFERRD